MNTNIYYIYILECINGKYYTGYTTDINKRYADHLSGKASKFTRGFKPVKIAVCWRLYGCRGDALRVEAMIKRISRHTKEKLILSRGQLKKLINDKLDISLRIEKINDKKIRQIEVNCT